MSNVGLRSQTGRLQVDGDDGQRQSAISERRIRETSNPNIGKKGES